MLEQNFYLPEGWKSLEEPLRKKIAEFEANGGSVRQVKEKFGSLYIYSYRVANPNHLDTSEEEALAETLCMECDQPAVGVRYVGWVGPRCKEHIF